MPSDIDRLNTLIGELETLTTESMQLSRADLDELETRELVDAMNAEDAGVPLAVARAADAITRAVDAIVERMRRGGRLFYVGAGTAGRLGVLDASECPPTFSTPPDLVVGLIAGGQPAIQNAVEGAEDDRTGAFAEFDRYGLCADDVVVGISASGRTPYVCGALVRAGEKGALTVAVAANEGSAIGELADIAIETVVGPEFVSGSTRLKAGTSQKLVLNMLSTLTMIKLGKTYHGVMVDLRASNEKLQARSIRTVASVTGCDHEEALHALAAVGGSVKEAILTLLTGVEPAQASQALAEAGGVLRVAIAATRNG